jgi:hypothetical protein
MPQLWVRYAIPAPAGEDGQPRVTLVSDKPAADAPGPIFEITVAGQEGANVEIPANPVPLWWIAGYEYLPVGYRGTVERIK